MFINSEYSDYIQKNLKTLTVLAISGFLLGFILGKLISPVETKVEKILLDKNFIDKSINTQNNPKK